MKKLLYLFLLSPFFFACNDDKKDADRPGELKLEKSFPTDTSDANASEAEAIDEAATERDGVQAVPEGEEPEVQKAQKTAGLAGKYRRMGADFQAGSCNCNCIEVSFSSPTQLCIEMEKIYISARYEKLNNTKANIFFNEVVRDEETERSLPWNDFDTNTPIATVTQQPDGSIKLDWLGFAVDGKIAVDFAIYGKKTLEGQYKKY